MPSWGTNIASPAAYLPIGSQPILGHVFLQLDTRAILSNIAFIPETPTDGNSLPPVAEEKGEFVGKGEGPQKDCLKKKILNCEHPSGSHEVPPLDTISARINRLYNFSIFLPVVSSHILSILRTI